MDFLQNHVESIVFCATEPVKPEEIRLVMSEMFEAEVQIEDINAALEALLVKYESEEFPFQAIKVAGGYQFLTKPAYQTSLGIFLKQKSKKRLSTSALEVMAIIAYKQPITKHQIEDIRGVSCDYAVQKLLEKELIDIKGKSDGVGRPLLYGTSHKFMEYFGINSLSELPNPKEFTNLENTIGDELDPNFKDFAKFGLMEGEGDAHAELEKSPFEAELDPLVEEGIIEETIVEVEEEDVEVSSEHDEENSIEDEKNEQQEEGEQ
jgi:segregation and condensation protein B